MERVLAILNDIKTAQSVLASARLLMRRLKQGQLDVLHPRPAVDPDFLPTEEVWTEERRSRFEARRDQLYDDLNDIFRGWKCEDSAAECQSLRQVVGPPEQTIASESRGADLVIVGQIGSGASPEIRATLHAALFLDAEAPVVVVPATPPTNLGKHVAVAWEASPPVKKAVAGMLPILLAAQQVTILIGRENQEETAPKALLHSLEQESVPARILRFELDGREIGTALLGEAKAAGADLLVMGAFSHNRYLERLFGGATEEILTELNLPIAMHH
ncbi:universal stress protein [Acidisoma sp. S159]|uniref:universal stress protein n=1 Tax=Acidisoma sp. S159 TaxID=1747225 RepID=UPI00131DE20C|nr:universal stress protein [Acidisoma sp. S159]